MKKNPLLLVRASASILFSERFFSIIGTSYLLTIIIILTIIGSLVFSIHFELGYMSMIAIILIGSILLMLLHGWYATIMPVRSIDTRKKIHPVEDLQLFIRYLPIYLSYVSWYTLIIFLLITLFFLFLVILSALFEPLGWIWTLLWIGLLFYWRTRMYFSWYHMFSEGSLSYKTFRESIMITKKRSSPIFITVLGYSLVIFTLTLGFEFGFGSIFRMIGSEALVSTTLEIIFTLQNNYIALQGALGQLIREYPGLISLTSVIFAILYGLSAVISRAMYHIFSVHYYLRLREIHESESSFLRPILMKERKKD